MRPYELTVLLHPDLEIDADTPIKKIEKLVEAADGKVTRRDNWGKKRLAYRINRQDFAVYVYFEIQVDPEKVRGLDANIRLAEEVMRHLMVSKPVVKPDSPKVAKAKAKRARTATEPAAETPAETPAAEAPASEEPAAVAAGEEK